MAPDTDLICCKCLKDGSDEKLARCYEKAMSSLKEYCVELNLFDLLQRVNAQWTTQKLAVHRSCRMKLKEELRHLHFIKTGHCDDSTGSDRPKRRKTDPDADGTDACSSSHPILVYKDCCIYCLSDATLYDRNPGLARVKYRVIRTIEVKDEIMKIALERGDSWGLEVAGRLAGIIDLVAEEARYHTVCNTRFKIDLPKPHTEVFTKVGFMNMTAYYISV